MINKVIKIIRLNSILGLLVLAASCAQQVAPSGGPKDIKYPTFIESKPANKTVKFPVEGQKIIIKFDEFIRLKDAAQQIVISPPPPGEKAPTIQENGKNIEILFNSNLERNTTYTINFGNAVADIHEESSVPDFKYVFSTGDYLDTNYIKGKILNAFTLNPERNVIVALYDYSTYTDTTIYKKKPSYFIRTKEDGSFSIENIPLSKFYMMAYKKEGDLKYSKGNELAIFTNPIEVKTVENTGYDSYLYKPDIYKANKLLNAELKYKGVYNINLYKSNSVIKAKTNKPYYIFKEQNLNGVDTFNLFVNANENDSFNIEVSNTDTTYVLQYKQKKKLKTFPFSITNINPINLDDTLTVLFSTPFSKILFDSILIKEDTNFFKPSFVAIDEKNHQYLRFWHKWQENTTYSFNFKDSSVIDIFNQFNNSTTITFTTKNNKDYGNLLLNVSLIADGQDYIIQLVDKDEKVIREKTISKSTDITFNGLDPVECRVKIIHDSNRNGKWDNGSFEKHIFPERVYYYKETLVIRAFWDLEQSININSLLTK